MKRLTNPTLTFEVPAVMQYNYEEAKSKNKAEAKVTIKQNNKVVLVRNTTDENNALTYDEGKFVMDLTTDDTSNFLPGVIKLELSIWMEIGGKDKYYISDTITANVDEVLNTGWDSSWK